MISGVYSLYNKVRNKKYIGSSLFIEERWKGHRRLLNKKSHDNPHLQRAWNKYGSEAFEFKTLLICDSKDLLFYEQLCIDGLNPEYNIALVAGAPMTGRNHSSETKKKMSLQRLGNKYSLGFRHTEETKQRKSQQQTGRKINQSGHPISEETKKKISLANIGRSHTEEVKKKLSLLNKGKQVSLETREKMKQAGSGRYYRTEETLKKLSIGIKKSWEKRRKEKTQNRDFSGRFA